MGNQQVDVCGISADLPLFRQLDDDETKNLVQGTFEHRIDKNEILFDPPTASTS